MKKQSVEVRVKNFFEVALGFSEEEARAEAKRCIQCKKPGCVAGCPVEIDIPGFIGLIRDGKYLDAIKSIKEKNSLPAVCGRVCPQEEQCEVKCVLGKKGKPIDIGTLERFAADWELANVKKDAGRRTRDEGRGMKDAGRGTKGPKVAVIGSGPGGLTCAADLAKMGYDVTLFESLHKAGGVLVYGIPEFRLPKKIVEIETEYIKTLGVDLKVDYVVGKTATIQELRKDALYLRIPDYRHCRCRRHRVSRRHCADF